MKRTKIFCFLIASLTALSIISGCRSPETAPVTPAPVTVLSSAPQEIRNGDFGGIALDSDAVTAASAAPVPVLPDTGTSVPDSEETAAEIRSDAPAAITTAADTTAAAATTTAGR